MPRLKPATFTITENQLEWLKEQSLKTGLTQVDIVRRALDMYAEMEKRKEQQHLFTPEQRREIKQVARETGVSETEVIRAAIAKDLRFKAALKRA